MVQAAALDSVVQLAGAVAGQNRYWRANGFDGADFRNADLIFTQILKQKCFKWFIGAVYLVNQQHTTRRWRLQSLQKRTANQIPVLVNLALNVGSTAFALSRPHVQKLRCIVPLIKRFALLQAVIALQANELALECDTESLCQLCLAHTRLAFQQQGPLQLECQKYSSRQAAVCKVASVLQGSCQSVNGLEENHLLSI